MEEIVVTVPIQFLTANWAKSISTQSVCISIRHLVLHESNGGRKRWGHRRSSIKESCYFTPPSNGMLCTCHFNYAIYVSAIAVKLKLLLKYSILICVCVDIYFAMSITNWLHFCHWCFMKSCCVCHTHHLMYTEDTTQCFAQPCLIKWPIISFIFLPN